MSVSKFISVLFVGCSLCACTSLPSSGPTSIEISKGAKPSGSNGKYAIVDITPAVASVVRKSVSRASTGQFSKLSIRPAKGIGIGDTLEITLYESSTGGLLSGKEGETASGMPQVKLPPQVVDSAGMISVPYAGNIKAASFTPRQVQATIVKRLAGRALEPQAIVTVTSNESRLVTISGDVEKAGRVPLNTGSERLLDTLALAGGARGRPDDSYVKLTRGSQAQEMLLSDIANSPKNNVQLQPGDQIFVYQSPQKFVALGASATNAEIAFASNSLTLSEAIGRAGGLDDSKSDPNGVFIFRYESPDIYRQLIKAGNPDANDYALVYRLDMRKPDSFLAAQRFPIRNKDVVYFANSPSTELSKFLTLVGSGLGVAGTGTSTVIRVTQ